MREFIAQLPPGQTMTTVAKGAKIPLSSLTTHIKHPSIELSVKNAKKLEKWSNGKISAAKTLGV